MESFARLGGKLCSVQWKAMLGSVDSYVMSRGKLCSSLVLKKGYRLQAGGEYLRRQCSANLPGIKETQDLASLQYMQNGSLCRLITGWFKYFYCCPIKLFLTNKKQG